MQGIPGYGNGERGKRHQRHRASVPAQGPEINLVGHGEFAAWQLTPGRSTGSTSPATSGASGSPRASRGWLVPVGPDVS
jgi:hypothetical protein